MPMQPIQTDGERRRRAAMVALLARAGADRQAMRLCAARAARHGTALHLELLAAGVVTEEGLYRALAGAWSVRFVESCATHRILMAPEEALALMRAPPGPALAHAIGERTEYRLIAAPARPDALAAAAVFARYPGLRDRLLVTSPGALRAAAFAIARPLVVDIAVRRLLAARADLSASVVLSVGQGFAVGFAVAGGGLLLALWPMPLLLALHVGGLVAFLGCSSLRLAAALDPPPPRTALPHVRRHPPVYSVLVPLHREAEMVPGLVAALEGLAWPRACLEIRLLCEEDDDETQAALARQRLPPHFAVIRVPAGEPRTKPKALNVGLQLTSGDLVVVYDAEDRPHPRQLLESWRRFRAAPATLAVLQAPLVIANGRENLLTALFAMEYRVLFGRLLPFLARHRMPVPLGGSSNHFRRVALERAHGWDAHNVTEDADLAIRLYRLGYVCDMLARPTIEVAPAQLPVWLRQRTRWLKGWMQTWLVHMRAPLRLWRELGPVSFVAFQLLVGAQVAAALLHGFLAGYAVMLAAKFAGFAALAPVDRTLVTLDAVNLAAGFVTALILAWRVRRPGSGLPGCAAAIPLYWLLISLAAWRAAAQLLRRPHLWEKTPHVRSAAVTGSRDPGRRCDRPASRPGGHLAPHRGSSTGSP